MFHIQVFPGGPRNRSSNFGVEQCFFTKKCCKGHYFAGLESHGRKHISPNSDLPSLEWVSKINHRHGCSCFFSTIYHTSITNHNLPFFMVSHISTRNLPMFLFQGQKNIILPFRIFPNVHHFSWVLISSP